MKLSTLRRLAQAVLLSCVAVLPAAAQTVNQAPRITSQPPRLATVKLGLSYAVRSEDADGDRLTHRLRTAPAAASIDATSGLLGWRPRSAEIGLHPFAVEVDDGRGGIGEQRFDLKVVEDFCAIYPIALPKSRIDGLAAGSMIDKLERGTGAGNFSWLTWTGATDAPTMARSLLPPGDSDTYVDPDDATDRLLNLGDWTQGSTGSMNADAVRTAMDVLKTIDIILPVWDESRGQGSRFDYHVQRFVTVRLTDYQLTGQGWLSFQYKGEAHCYNRAPVALPQSVSTDEDVPVAITLAGTDPEDDALTYTVLDGPTHGALSGTAPALTYTPAPGYYGPDAFTFRVNDGQLDSPPARVDIMVRLVNRAPTIVSPAVTIATESNPYRYDVDATDPDNDMLEYSLERSPADLSIASGNGVISGIVDGGLVQPVRAFNAQCYVIPEDVELEGGDGTAIAVLFQDVRSALKKGSAYAAPQTLTWHRQHTCLGCHVQNQTLVGLQGSMGRADVDEEAAEFLLSEILASQLSDGSIRRSHPEHAVTQTAFALWALSYVPDRSRTFAARERSLRFFLARMQRNGVQAYWNSDHPSGWLNTASANTALFSLGASRFLSDAARLSGVTPEQVALGLQLRPALAGAAEFLLAQSATSSDNLTLALNMFGLAQTEAHLDDATLRGRVRQRLVELDATLRSRAAADGGWARQTGAADPLVSAWVGFALDTQDPGLSDALVLANIRYLLDSQQADGTWRTSTRLFETHLGTTGLVMAYLPVALQHLGNPDLTLGHMKIEAQGDAWTLSVEAINRGLADAEGATGVSFFTGRDAEGDLLGQLEIAPLRSGEHRWISIPIASLPEGEVSATIAVQGGLPECQAGNNFTRAALTIPRATDPHALFDTQPYLLNLEDFNAAPVITSEPLTHFEQGREYDYQVTVADADVGDAHLFELATAPAGLYINPLTGRFGYELATLAAGTHTVRVRVTDLRGATAEQTFQLAITPNRPPEIVSTPTLRVYLGDTYRYDVDATDPDGDVPTYRLDGAPLTMSIDAESGQIVWTPEQRHLGDNAVAVIADDGRGGTDRQVFTIKVETLPVNRAPTITSSAPPQVGEGEVYEYDVDAVDPDLDVLRYSTDRDPSPSSIDAAIGRLRWPADDAFVGSLRAQNPMCRLPSGPGLFDPEVSWTWKGPNGLTQYSDVYGPVLVGQFTDDNSDGRVDERDSPDLVAMSGPGQRYLNLIDGRTGANHWSIRVDSIAQFGTPAIGDIDGDGGMEIVAEFGTRAEELRAFDADGRELWRTPVEARTVLDGGSRDAVALADLEGDGDVEIVRGRTIVEHTGQVRCSGEFHGGGTDNYAYVSAVADVDRDGIQEVIAGGSIYRPDCTRKTQLGAVADGFVGIGNFDADEQAEIVLVSNGHYPSTGRLYLFNHDGSLKFGPVSFPGGGALGPPTLANVDADPYPEIGVAGQARYALFDHDGTKRWEAVVQDPSSNQTGSTSFDFEADGRAEIIYSDEKNLRVYDGLTGTERLKLGNNSGTTLEYPVVVDADADGSADILLGANGTGSGIRKISSATRSWAPTRALWNQHTYHVDNISDDGSIPRQPVASWLTHNTYRLNTFPDRHAYGLADLALFDLRLDESSGTTIKMLAVNRGLAPTSAASTVRVFNGEPDAGGTLLGSVEVPVLAAGESRTLALTGLAGAAVDDDLYARVDEAGAIIECDDDNNSAMAAYFVVRASDPEPLFDTQRFTVWVENANAAPRILSTALPEGAINEAFRSVVEASDPDLGDGLRFELIAGPAGMSIDPVSGELRWTPGATQGGSHTVNVRVVDLGGLSAQREFTLAVPTNRAPVITTTAITTGQVDIAYRYDVDATDPDGDTLNYTFTNAPITMAIDAASGVITWTPTAAGSFPVLIEVLDGRGGKATQSYTLVVAAPVNRAPTITSTAPPSVREGVTYAYPISATDPDGDALVYRYTTAPQGTVVGAASGALSWPAADRLVGSIRTLNSMCRDPAITAGSIPFAPVAKWTWGRRAALSMPLVGPLRDTNLDGVYDSSDVPTVLINTALGFIDGAQGTLVALDGATGQELWENATAGTRASATPAIGDLDGDGAPEIVAFTANGGVAAFDHAGRELWRTPTTTVTDNGYNYGSIALYDLEGDGRSEILHHGGVLNNDGTVRWRTQIVPWNRVPTYAIDLDADGVLEVVIGPYLYSATGVLQRTIAGGNGGWVLTSPGNFDADPEPEFAVVLGNYYSSATEIRVLDTDWSQIWSRIDPNVTRGGPPVVSDLDGNGMPDISFIGMRRHVAYSGTGELLWSNPISDGSTGTNGSTSFDFDGDGTHEVVSQDENKLRVFDGRTGHLLFEAPHSSPTAAESPIVADVDGDGHADIVVEGQAANGASVGVYSDVANRWVATRSIWNQYSYHIDNVGDDGSIPRHQAKGWLTHNTYRLNALAGGHPLGLADLALFDLRLLPGEATALEVRVVNRGLAPTAVETSISFYNGEPDAGGALLGTLAVPPLAAGEERVLQLGGLPASAVSTHLFARIDESGSVDECLDGNNETAAAYFVVRATDPAGLFDSQRFTATVENANEAPALLTTSLPPAAANQAYSYPLQARDADVGDGLRFELVAAPAGLAIEAVSGQLRWTPAASQTGTHQVRVRVVDLGGLASERSYDVLVSDNRPPQITSSPATSTPVNVEYRYDVEATDADGDSLSYGLTQAPSGMQIDGVTGLIRWTPTSAGDVDVEVRVLDSRGSFALQRYTLAVQVPPNNAPTITSTPSTTASPGRIYTYLVDATDPDGDVLSVLLPVKPAGMTLNELSGQLSWTPTAAQVGTHAVQVQVIDGRGGIATQNFSIVVNQIVGNQPPAILSTPPFTAKAGREYLYPVQAEDPNGDALTYSLIQAPSGMTIGADGTIRWTPAAAGSAAVRVRVADAQAWVEQTWTITVLAADVPLNALVNITPTSVQPGGTITLQVLVEGAASQPTVTATIDGQPLPLDPDGSTTLTAPTAPGSHTIIVTVTDGFDTDTTQTTFTVIDPNGGTPPTVQIHAPREGATEELLVITSPRDVVASVSDDNLRRWSLQLFERGAPGSEGILLASGTATVANAEIGQIDPTLLMNGQYALVLNAEDASGNTAQDVVGVSIEGAMKLGHFSIGFEDLNLPVSGIPVTVSRTYDTRTRHRNLDFGYGWGLSYQNVRIHESRRPGFGWEFKVYPTGPLGLIPRYCMESALGNVVSVTLADGKVEKFRAKAVPECNDVLPLVEVDIVFEPMPGTHGKLAPLDDTHGRLINGSIAQLDMQDDAVDPDNYLYTDKDGVEFSLDQNFGLRKIHERAGDNQIVFGRDGIVHSNGTSVSFVRNAAGRITKVIAPDASELTYEYDAGGNLTAFVDAGGNRTTFTYLAGHYLQDIIDPRGVRVSRNEYDDDGRLVAIVDADGNRIEYTRDLDGRVETVKDRNGGRTVYVYNDRGDILAETNPEGETTHRTYDANGNELSRTDALGRTQRWTYDGLGNVLTETNPEGETSTSVYGSFNHLLTETDSAGRVEVRNTWRNITLPGTGVEVYPGPMISATDANGAVTSFGYDPVTGELNRITDPTGASSSIVTDGRGYTVAEIDALGRRTDYVVDDLGRRLEMRRSRTKSDGSVELLVTRHAYDASGNLVETEHPDGSVTRSEYDLTGRVTAQVDALGRRTEYEYNDRGDETEVRHPDGSVESRSYDASGNLVAQTDALGAVTKFVYDSMNRLVETIHPDETPASEADNPRSRSVYDAAGQMIESIDANGHTTRYEYDDAGRRTRTVLAAVDGVTATVTDAYDVSGRRTSSTDAAGNVTLFRYDAAGRLVETEQDGAIIRFEHDAAGRKVAEIDPAGRVTRYVHDALGRIISVVLPNPSTGANPPLVAGSSPDSGTLTTRYVYDEVGNKLSQTDAEGRVTRWEYDAMGRETARILPEGQRETKRYNAAGELVESTDFNGESTRYGYDGAGRVERIDYPTDTDVAFRHNAAGLRISVTDARGDSTTAFDSRGRVVRSRDADGGAIEYSYDAAGNLLSRASPSQSLVYVYDARNRLSQVTRTVDGELPTVTRYEYDANGNRIAMLGGDGIRTEYAYDDRHRLTNLVKKTGTGLTLLAMNYTVDSSGMRTAVEESDSSGPLRTVVFGYDAARRLTREAIDHRDSVEDRVSAWTYDRVGNRLSQTVTTSAATETTTYAYDDNDRLEQEIRTGGADPGTTSYGYDANGNTLTKVAPSGTTTYRYDDANRLVQATTPEGVTSYVYSADGLRVRQLHTPSGGPTATTWYVQDSAYPYAQVIEEYKSVGSEPKRLAATFTFADDLVSQTRYDSAGVPTTHFVQADGFGSTRWLTDASGGLTDSIEYDAFGSEISRTGSTDVEHLHRAERFDANVGHYDLRARLYNPANGRFLTQDTFLGVAADPQSLHKYLYANANPVLYSDPSGNMSLTEMGTALNTMARLAVSSVRIVGRSSIRKARAVVKYWIATAKTAVRRCIQKPERCDLDTPLIIEGNDTPHTSRHVRDAQLGGGSNLFPSGVLFHRTAPPANRRWYRGMAECNKSARGLFGGLAACDEFPYATAKEGGPGNYPIRTSLRLVPIIEASPQGVKLEAFYRLCGIQRDHPKKSEFLAIGMPEVHSLVLPPPLSCFDSK